ncbi:MAG: hypothetical protein PHV11_08465 [Candidatus Bipolaricaulis sp.]|nr:hypothetical protein [Candidatus Bipolaricaulis sp.]
MEKKSYEIQGKTLTQGEMTLGQTKRLIASTTKLVGADVTKIKDVSSAVSWLVDNNLIDQALDVILVGDKNGIIWDDLTNTQLEAIVSDFLSFNGEWIGKLSDSLKNLLKSPAPVMKKTISGKS